MINKKTVWSIWFLGFGWQAVAANLDPVFTDDMVLQRDRPVHVYGFGPTDGERVVVSFGKQSEKTTVKNGVWDVWLKPMKANMQGQTLTVLSGNESVSCMNILVGDVWVLGGQSNMMRPIRMYPDLLPVIQEADQPLIRTVYIDWPRQAPKQSGEAQPLLETPEVRHSKWGVCVYQNAEPDMQQLLKDLSPIGYFFATNLVAHTGVPVGLIMACRGGTKAQWWVPEGMLERFSELERYVDEADPNTSYLYNSTIYPIRKYTVFGVLWYQGEADNPLPEEYGLLFPRMIQSWRETWGYSMPFLFASLSSFKWDTDSWAYLREAQTKGLAEPKTGMIMTYDIGDYADIHPAEKRIVGYRFFKKACEVAYGEDLVSSGPVFDRLEIEGSCVAVYFKNTGGGLVTQRVSMPKNTEKTEFYAIDADELAGFSVCGPDGIFHPAHAVIQGKDCVAVCSSDVEKPVAVRYGWASFVLANLFNREGFPAEVFRTDTFPVPHFVPPLSAGVTVSSDNSDWGEKTIIAKKSFETSVVPVTRGWRTGWQVDDPGFSMMYFDVPDASFSRGASPSVRLTVVYFDEGRGVFHLRYDSSDSDFQLGKSAPGVWKEKGRIALKNTGTWKTCTFDISDAEFSRRCNGHDLRIEKLPKGVVIGDVYIRKMIGGIQLPSAENRQVKTAMCHK